MQRRKFLIGVGGTALGGSALLGSGAFSRVESQRQVSIQVATDPNAYLGLKPSDTPNGNNFAAIDDDGHIFIDIGDFANADHNDPDDYDYTTGVGVNSDSFTWFDNVFEICNQGKADAVVSYELPDPPSERNIGDDWQAPHADYDDQVVGFYWINDDGERVFVNEGQEVPLELGDCVGIGVRTVTKGVDANIDAPLIDGEVVVTADSPAAGGGT